MLFSGCTTVRDNDPTFIVIIGEFVKEIDDVYQFESISICTGSYKVISYLVMFNAHTKVNDW